MVRAVVTGGEPPSWAIAAAAAEGVELVPLGTAAAASEVSGYVMNSFGVQEPEPVTADVLTRLPDLQVVIYLGQSQDPMDYASFVDLEVIRSASIALATTPAGDAVAEAALGMMIAADLNLVAAAADPRLWIGRQGLAGSTLGVVGLGQIGRRVAELAVAMGMDIGYVSRREHSEVESELGARRRTLEELCAEADFISVHTSNSAPVGLIGSALEHANGVALINSTSAPKLIDPAALLNALETGKVRRAVVEGAYPDPWQEQLSGCGPDRYVSLPVYSSWDTSAARETGWNQAIAALTAVRDGTEIPNRLV